MHATSGSAIHVEHARKAFGGVVALDGAAFQVPAGGRVALVGPNGSGKSTLVRALMGLVPCGGLSIDGLDAFTCRAALAPRTAYVPQIAPNLNASAGEVIAAVAALRGLDARAIADVAARLHLRVDDIARRPVRALSGGMKQKLLIALALAAPVSLLVLDEPTASLDAASRDVFFDLVDARALRSTTVLLSSHSVEEVRRVADRVITLEDGRVASDEPAAAWLAGRGGWQACA